MGFLYFFSLVPIFEAKLHSGKIVPVASTVTSSDAKISNSFCHAYSILYMYLQTLSQHFQEEFFNNSFCFFSSGVQISELL
jgi:hypothetical protein